MDMPSLAREVLAALAIPAQQSRPIRIDATVAGLSVERFPGAEAVCAPFRFQVDVLSTPALIDPDALPGRPLPLYLRQTISASTAVARAVRKPRQWVHGLARASAPRPGQRMHPQKHHRSTRQNILISGDGSAL